MDQTHAQKPIWQLVLQFPLTRIIVLGGILFYVMGTAEYYLDKFKSTPVQSIMVMIGIGLVAVAIYVAWAKLIERRDASELSLPGMGREWAIGALLGAGLYTCCVLILMALGIFRIDGFNPWTFLIPGIAFALKSGLHEELIFRGVFYKSVEDMFGSWISIVASSLLFGFLHLLNPDATFAGAAYISIEAGLLLAAAYLVTRRLWMCIGFHMAWNYVQSAVFSGIVSGGVADPGLIVKTIQGPDLLTGGNFGMEQSLIALILDTTAGVVLLIIAIRRGNLVPPPWMRRK